MSRSRAQLHHARSAIRRLGIDGGLGGNRLGHSARWALRRPCLGWVVELPRGGAGSLGLCALILQAGQERAPGVVGPLGAVLLHRLLADRVVAEHPPDELLAVGTL